MGPVPLWTVVAVGAGGLVRPGSVDGGPRAAVGRSLPALTTELISPVGAGLLVAAVGALTLLVLAHRGRGRDQLGLGVGVLALVVVAATVSGGVALRDEAARAGVLPRLAATGGALPMELTVVAEPRPIARGWHVLARVDEVSGTAVRERVALVLEDEPPALGERWRARASARPLPDGGYGDWLAQQHARVVLDVERIERLGPGGPAARSTEWLRDRVRTAATRWLDERTGGLLVGFVTGDTRLLPAEDRAAMQATSLTHLTAVSGQSVREQGALAERPRPGDRLPGSVLPVVMASLGRRPPSPAPTRASRQAHVHLIILTPRGGLEPHCSGLTWRPTATPGSASRARGVSSSARGHSSGIHRVIGRCGLIARRCRSSRGLAARSQPSPADLLTGGRTVPA